MAMCWKCNGSGKIPSSDGTYMTTCYECGGSGNKDDAISSGSSDSSSGYSGGGSYDSEHDMFFEQGQQCLKARNYDKAIANFTQAINSGGRWTASSYRLRGSCYLEKGNHDQAIDDFTKSLNFDGDTYVASTYFNRGCAYFESGNEEQAISDWKQAADLGDTSALKALSDRGIQYTPQKRSSSSGGSKKFKIIGAVALGVIGFFILDFIGLIAGAVGGWFLGGIIGKKFFVTVVILGVLGGGLYFGRSYIAPIIDKGKSLIGGGWTQILHNGETEWVSAKRFSIAGGDSFIFAEVVLPEIPD